MTCNICGSEIHPERLEIFPDTRKCVECAKLYPEGLKYDPNEVCAKSSPSGQNGWSSKS